MSHLSIYRRNAVLSTYFANLSFLSTDSTKLCPNLQVVHGVYYNVLQRGEAVSSTITIRLPDDLRSELEAISKAENKLLSDVVRESLRRYVAIQQFRLLRKNVLPFAESQGLLTDEDIFDAIS